MSKQDIKTVTEQQDTAYKEWVKECEENYLEMEFDAFYTHWCYERSLYDDR